MTPKKLRWGILGVAAINDRLMPALKASTTAALQAVASRTFEKARDYAAKHVIPFAYGSYEELLADDEIDAVYIPLPNHLHDEWTRKAADAGKHVLCEKPLTCDAKSAEELVAYCRAKGVRLMDGFMWPHHLRTRKIREVIDADVIGAVRKVVAAFSFKLEGLPPTNIRMQRGCGGGSLLDVGCYPVYAIRWWMGAEPVKVMAHAKYVNDVDVEMSGVLTFANGRTAHFDCGFVHPLRTWVEIVGTDATLWVPNMWIPDEKAEFRVVRQKGEFGADVQVYETPGEDQMVHMLDDFAAAVRENREPVPNPDEAVKTLRVLDALARSAREGREVDVV